MKAQAPSRPSGIRNAGRGMISRQRLGPMRSTKPATSRSVSRPYCMRPRLVAEHQRAEEHLAQRIAGKDRADLPLRSRQLGEVLKHALLADAAVEEGIGDVVQQPGDLRAELDDPAAIVAVRDRAAAKRRIGIEQDAFARDVRRMARRPRGAQGIDEGRAPFAQPLAIGCRSRRRASRARAGR